jgi:hypothetical protein
MVVKAQEGMSDLAAVRLAYESSSDREIKGTTDEIGYDQWEIRTPVFFKEAGDWKFAAGVRYQSTNLDFTDPTDLDEDRLHSLDLAFFLSKKSSDTLDWLFLFNPTLAGDYENTDSDAFNYLTIAGAKWKQSDNLQWIFGAVYTTGIGDDLFVPAIGLIWEPSDRSSLVFAGPIIRYSYQLSDSLALKLGGQFVGNRWNTEATYGGGLEERNVRYRSYRVSANLQWSFDDHHSIFAGGGYDFAGEFEIESPTLNTDRDVENGGVFEIGYQYQF